MKKISIIVLMLLVMPAQGQGVTTLHGYDNVMNLIHTHVHENRDKINKMMDLVKQMDQQITQLCVAATAPCEVVISDHPEYDKIVFNQIGNDSRELKVWNNHVNTPSTLTFDRQQTEFNYKHSVILPFTGERIENNIHLLETNQKTTLSSISISDESEDTVNYTFNKADKFQNLEYKSMSKNRIVLRYNIDLNEESVSITMMYNQPIQGTKYTTHSIFLKQLDTKSPVELEL